uniref:Bromo domain-containing protein n=1 Tax=Ditylenchus dipsaci TaxID=166011 RepID=A0A915D1K4_9BILA
MTHPHGFCVLEQSTLCKCRYAVDQFETSIFGGLKRGEDEERGICRNFQENFRDKNGSAKGGSLNSSETGGHSLPGSSSPMWMPCRRAQTTRKRVMATDHRKMAKPMQPPTLCPLLGIVSVVGNSSAGKCNGMVQPRVIPPVGKPTRHTNQLDFIAKEPVDAIKLNIPDYHKVIKRPMDLGTIEKRLQNVYYYSADDCLRDVGAVMTNCFLFNEEADVGVYPMGKSLEQFILNKMNKIPANTISKKAGKGGSAAATKKSAPTGAANRPTLDSAGPGSIGGTVSPANSNSSVVPPESTAAVLDYFHNATVQASRESSIQRGLPDSSSSTNNAATASSSGLTTVSEVSSLAIAEPPARPSKVQKGVKRKADTTTSFDEEGQVAGTSSKEVVEKKASATAAAAPVDAKKRDVRPIKKPAPVPIDYTTLKPRFKGKLTEQMKFCQRIVSELLSKRCKNFAWPSLNRWMWKDSA